MNFHSPILGSISIFSQMNATSWWITFGVIVAAVLALCYVFRYFVFVRLPLWILTHTIYRVKSHGIENVPSSGPALLVCNHLSHIDAGIVQAGLNRPIRFLIWAPFFSMFWLRPLLKLAKVIPIQGNAGPRAIIKSLRTASDALANGEIVCIFAEGGITRTGFMLPFHRGLEQIVKRTPAPIIPVCLDHVWGSVFSFRGGRFFWKLPQQVPYPVHVTFGKPLPATTNSGEVRQAIQKLSADSSIARSETRLPVHRQFVRQACRNPFRSCFIDPHNKTKPVLKYGEALAGAKIFTRLLEPILKDQDKVGMWIPPSVGGALANIAVAFMRKVAVNLNYTSSPEVVRSTINQCGIRKILTSRLFIQKVGIDPGPDVELIYLEDFRKQISNWDRTKAFLSVLLVPGFIQERWILKLGSHSPKDLATIIFSSGSTGEPKGVMLSHKNIAANAESMIQAIDLNPRDRIMGILPFFHSFGYTVTLWVPLQVGVSTIFQPNPLQSKEIGTFCKDYKCTILLSTPTFLRSYLKRCQPDDFLSLRILICGAEKMSQALAEEFADRFKIKPLEGYGCTELSPVAAANVPDWQQGSQKQIGNKPGTIGQPIPGVAAKVVDRETLEDLPLGQEGLLLIYGANVMEGYLNREDLTRKKIIENWYVTGDLGKIDEDGFITITGRQERFAKIGGEMVPLERVEEELHQVLETNERTCAVTSIPDSKKGERIIVLHLPLNGKPVDQLGSELSKRGLPNLYIPGNRDYFEVEELPIIGAGKLDIKKCKEMAMELAAKVA